MAIRDAIYGVFHPGWLIGGTGVGLGLQLLGWVTGVGLVGGLPGYLLMGVLVGWLSPGDTILEPGVAAFLIATLGFVIDHLILSLLGIGLVFAMGYGVLGLGLGLLGGWIGERLQGM